MVAVELREWRRADATAVAALLDDPRITRWSHMAELGPERWIATQREGARGPSMAVCDVEDGRLLGKVALRLPGKASPATSCAAIRREDHPVGELSYWVLPQERGRGVASSAVRAMLERAGRIDGVRSVLLDIEADNVGSIRVAERVGAVRREPTRVELDGSRVPRTLAVFVIEVRRRSAC